MTSLLDVLAELRSRLAAPDADFTWASWRDAEHALTEVDELTAAVRAGDVPRERIRFLFLPTGPAQEVSLSSGWGNEFLELAQRCDRALEGDL